MRRIAMKALLLMIFAAQLHASELCNALLQRVRNPQTDRIKLTADIIEFDSPLCFFEAISRQVPPRDLLAKIEAIRTDKQSGSDAGSGGTSLIARGVTAKTLSVAAEYGALTQSTSGSTVTVRGNLAGLPAALIRKNVFPYCNHGRAKLQAPGFCFERSILGQLRKISFGVSFDTTRNNQGMTATVMDGSGGVTAADPPAAEFHANRREVAGVSARYEIWNRRDVTSAEYVTRWEEMLKEKNITAIAQELTATTDAILDAVEQSEAYKRWRLRAHDRLMNAGAAELEETVIEQYRTLAKDLLKEKAVDAGMAAKVSSQYSQFGLTQDELIDLASSEPVLTFEYLYNRPLEQQPTSTVRLIFDLPVMRGWSLIANGAFTLYDPLSKGVTSPQVGAFRDAQFGIQSNHTIKNIFTFGSGALSFSYYYQNQISPAVLNVDPANPIPGITFINLPNNATKVFASKGNLHIGQIRLELGAGNSVRFPLAVSYSNRTELINKPTWRAQIGISYDFDSLFAKER
jgi:hypothetical protein